MNVQAMIDAVMEQRDALLFGKWTKESVPRNDDEACAVRYGRSDGRTGLCYSSEARRFADSVAREMFNYELLGLNYAPATKKEDILAVYDETIRRLKDRHD